MVVRKLKPLPVEVVVRRFITGSLWREYQQGHRELYGLKLPSGLNRDQRFDRPILTPTTKAALGQHDAPISPDQIQTTGLVPPGIWPQVETAAEELFARGESEAAKCGLLLVDTKYEFGLDGRALVLMDEVHTPDSSRYWEAAGYRARFAAGQPQEMLDKENIRQWLLERGFSGQGRPPVLTDQVRLELARTYLALQKRLTGQEPELPSGDAGERLRANLSRAGILPAGGTR
jgi:phosphoribosylaminoimidazole-succinocarboxamide synthase